jgi:ABC-type transporter Mla subunit MlaD
MEELEIKKILELVDNLLDVLSDKRTMYLRLLDNLSDIINVVEETERILNSSVASIQNMIKVINEKITTGRR